MTNKADGVQMNVVIRPMFQGKYLASDFDMRIYWSLQSWKDFSCLEFANTALGYNISPVNDRGFVLSFLFCLETKMSFSPFLRRTLFRMEI